jgi:hypothetical protein
MSGAFASGRPNAVAQPISQNNRGSDQVGTAIRSLGRTSMAVDAVLGVDEPAPVCSRVIDALPFCGTGLRQKRSKNQLD